MTGPAIILMVVTILIIWGGLVGSMIALKVLPEPDPVELPATTDAARTADAGLSDPTGV